MSSPNSTSTPAGIVTGTNPRGGAKTSFGCTTAT